MAITKQIHFHNTLYKGVKSVHTCVPVCINMEYTIELIEYGLISNVMVYW